MGAFQRSEVGTAPLDVNDIAATDFGGYGGFGVFGSLELTRTYLPAVRAQHGGTIIFVGSLIAEFLVPFQSGYAASKLALSA